MLLLAYVFTPGLKLAWWHSRHGNSVVSQGYVVPVPSDWIPLDDAMRMSRDPNAPLSLVHFEPWRQWRPEPALIMIDVMPAGKTLPNDSILMNEKIDATFASQVRGVLQREADIQFARAQSHCKEYGPSLLGDALIQCRGGRGLDLSYSGPARFVPVFYQVLSKTDPPQEQH